MIAECAAPYLSDKSEEVGGRETPHLFSMLPVDVQNILKSIFSATFLVDLSQRTVSTF